MGLNIDTVCIQSGMNVWGVNAVLMNSSGKVRNPPIANTVSELLVFNPIVREIPDQASPKKATVMSMSRNPTIPVTKEAPKAYANAKIIND